MIYHNLNPEILSFGPIGIRWYGLIYASGFILAYYLIHYLSKKKGKEIPKDDLSDYIFYLILGVLGGARLGYVIFYNAPYYLSNPLDIIAIWQGGLSFHGGFIGGIIATVLFCRKKKMELLGFMDMASIPLALGLAFGRIGNFINGELIGRITEIPFCIDYTKNQYISASIEGCRHASQLYESFYSAVIFGILLAIYLSKKKFPKGLLTSLFIILYGLFRFIAEFFRQPDSQIGFLIGGLTMGQLLCIPMILIGGWMLWEKITKTRCSELSAG